MDESKPKASLVSARLAILLVAALGLGVAFAVKTSSPPSAIETSPDEPAGPAVPVPKEISQYDLPGEEPAEPPEFDVRFTVDTSSIKNRLIVYITETHGYYVESPALRVWWKGGDPDLPRENAEFSLLYRMNNFIKANETFKDCFEVSAPEVQTVGGDVGEAQNWGVEIESYGRARAKNPETFPPVSSTGRYCSS